MSSIIKGGRIRNQGIINLSERTPIKVEVEEIYEESTSIHGADEVEGVHVTSKAIEEKRKELEALEAQINEKIEDANAEVARILSEAYAKAKQIKDEAITEQNNILSDACKEQQQMLKETEVETAQIKEEALNEKQQMLSNVEGEVVETMITLLRHIISEELSYNESWLSLVVRKMLQNMDMEEVTLCVSPHQYQQLGNERNELIQSIAKLANIKEDESLNDSTCKLITSEGNIEYDVNQGLEKVISELRILKKVTQE